MNKLNIDIDALREASYKAAEQKALDAKKQELLKAELAKTRAEQAKWENEQRAANIIEEIPAKCAAAADCGNCHAVIMELDRNNDYIYGSDELVGAAKLVWQACEGAKLKPLISRENCIVVRWW